MGWVQFWQRRYVKDNLGRYVSKQIQLFEKRDLSLRTFACQNDFVQEDDSRIEVLLKTDRPLKLHPLSEQVLPMCNKSTRNPVIGK